MSLVPAKCTECGANLEVDASKDAAVCPYCGAAFITEKAINNYNIANVQHADIKAEKVVVNVKKQDDSVCLRYKKTKGGWYVNDINYAQAEQTGGVTIPATFKGEPVLWVKETLSFSMFDYVLVDPANKYIRMESGCLINNETNTVVSTNGDEIDIPQGITAIGEGAFSCCEIKEIHIPSSVKRAGINAFFGSEKNLKVYIEDLKAWCEIDFENMEANPLYCYKGQTELYVNGEKIEQLMIPDGVTKIGNYAFARYSSLKEIVLPSSVTSIGKHAFMECNELASVMMSGGVTSIEEAAFSGCVHLKRVVLSDGLKTIGSQAFTDCKEMEEISIPSTVTEIGSWAFYDCRCLKNIVIPDGVTDIGSQAFCSCSYLESVVIPDGVTTVKEETFCLCKELSEVYIPYSVKEIGEKAFCGCNLSKVRIGESVSVGSDAFKVYGDKTEPVIVRCSEEKIKKHCPVKTKSAKTEKSDGNKRRWLFWLSR